MAEGKQGVQDAWRAYLELALGMTEASKKKAQKAAKRLAGKGGATAAQLQALAEDLVSTGAANRETLTKLVRFEVDRALGVVGLATADEVAELTNRVRDLERELQEARAAAVPVPVTAQPAVAAIPASDTASAPVTTKAVGKATVPTKAVAKKAVAKKAVAKKTVAKKTVAKAVAGSAPANKAVADSTAANTAAADSAVSSVPAKSAVAKRAVAKRTAAKKTAPPAAGPVGEAPA
jgi:polyhydroxyalkanoate synthesis regulator phasin